jgi:fructosamine-3-kinase
VNRLAEQAFVSRMPLPLKAAQITAEWLSTALAQRYPGVAVTTFEVTDVMAMTSTKLRLRLEYNDCGRKAALPPTLIVKGGFGEHAPPLAMMYRNEVNFYGLVAPHLSVNAPRSYFAGTDPDTHQSIVILEDLAPKRVTFCTPRRALDYHQAARFLDALARYHAQTWDSRELAAGGRFDWVKPRFEGGFGTAYFYERYLQAEYWHKMIAGPRGAVVARKLHDREWACHALRKVFDEHARFPRCLLHGDCHTGNTYYEADGTPGFIDFQPEHGSWVLDVTKHMVGGLDIDDRRAWERPLLAYYLERLEVYGVTSVPRFEQAWETHRRCLAYCFIVFVVNENQYQTEDVNLAYLVRYATAALDLGTRELLC